MKEESIEKKETLDYSRSNIFEALDAYTGWKTIMGSKSKGIVSAEMAERYVEIQNYHPDFFLLVERSFLIQFVMLILHSFDSDTRSHSLYRVDKGATDKFVQENKEILNNLRELRNKLFAHRDVNIDLTKLRIPSIDNLDSFFKNLIKFYNQLCAAVEDSSTIFSNAEEVKREIEYLFMNLYRGEQVRRQGIKIERDWKANKGQISEVLPDIVE